MKSWFKIITYILKHKVSIVRTIYFNFHYLPFEDAVEFPIILYKSVRFKKADGQIIIEADRIRSGMIHIGNENYGFQWKNDYTVWEQLGGKVIVEDGVILGKGTFISVGENAILRFGQNVSFGGNARLICMKSITIKSNTMVAWDVSILDTDFKSTFNTITNTINLTEKPVLIGSNNWLCFGCKILKGSVTPDFCIVSAGTIINKDYTDAGEMAILSMNENVKVIAKGIRFNML
jgi:hypothetical protein